MQTAVERVIRSFTPKSPIKNGASDVMQDDAGQFAAALLENYKVQLAERSRANVGSRDD